MSIKTWIVSGLPPGAAQRAQRDGHARVLRAQLDDKALGTMRHRVRGQEVQAFAEKGLAEACATEMLNRGLVVTLRRWRPPKGRRAR